MAENIENNGCSQRDNAEHEGYVKASRSFNRIWKERDSAQPRLLEAILYKDNFNRAYKRVKANKGAPGIDGMTIEAVSYTHLDVYKRQEQDSALSQHQMIKYSIETVILNMKSEDVDKELTDMMSKSEKSIVGRCV